MGIFSAVRNLFTPTEDDRGRLLAQMALIASLISGSIVTLSSYADMQAARTSRKEAVMVYRHEREDERLLLQVIQKLQQQIVKRDIHLDVVARAKQLVAAIEKDIANDPGTDDPAQQAVIQQKLRKVDELKREIVKVEQILKRMAGSKSNKLDDALKIHSVQPHFPM